MVSCVFFLQFLMSVSQNSVYRYTFFGAFFHSHHLQCGKTAQKMHKKMQHTCNIRFFGAVKKQSWGLWEETHHTMPQKNAIPSPCCIWKKTHPKWAETHQRKKATCILRFTFPCWLKASIWLLQFLQTKKLCKNAPTNASLFAKLQKGLPGPEGGLAWSWRGAFG